MGWLFSSAWGTRNDLVKELTRNESHRDCLAHCLRGNVLWTVWEVRNGDLTSRYIGCDLLQVNKGEWGYKDMDESVGPNYYTCPIKYLGMVPQVTNQEWRDAVVVRDNINKMEVNPGIIYQLNEGYICKYLKITHVFDKNKFSAEDRNGKAFTVKRSYLSGATFETWPEGS